MRCIAQPISWLRLEQHALAADPAVAAHLAECAGCRACFATIEADRGRVLPPLGEAVLATRRHRAGRVRWAVAGSALAAAAVLVMILIGREPPDGGRIKGGDDVSLGLVRERAGAIAHDAGSFRPGDRFKVLVTCAAEGEAMAEVTVEQGGEVFRPLEPAAIRCGNRVPVPGAFSLSGSAPVRVCVSLAGAADCASLTAE